MRRTLAALLLWLLCAVQAHAAPVKSLGFADLSNATYSGRALSAKLGDVVSVRDYGAKGDAVTDDCNAFRNALATGRSIYVPKPGAYNVACQLSMVTDGQEVVCEGHVLVKLAYPSGPQIVAGGAGATTSNNIGVRNCTLIAMQTGQPMFFVRYLRGFRLIENRIFADQLIKLGDATLGTSKYAYIVELFENDMARIAGATMHFVNAENFGGQFVAVNNFYEGASHAGTSGFRCADNIRPRVDDFHMELGYWSRDDVNLDFKDCRVVNAKIVGLHSEGALSYAVRLETTSSTAKSAGDVGFGGVEFIGGRYDGGLESFFIKNDRLSTDSSVLQIAHVQITGAASTRGAVWIEGAGGPIQQVTLDDIRGTTMAATTTIDWVTLKGSDTSNTLDGILIDNIGGRSYSANPLRSQVRTEGTRNTDIWAGYNVLTGGAGARFSDPSGVLAHP